LCVVMSYTCCVVFFVFVLFVFILCQAITKIFRKKRII